MSDLVRRVWGARACIRAREGYAFCSVDYSALELCTLAQVCLWTVGYSRMAEIINKTKKPGKLHAATAADMIGMSFETFERELILGSKSAKNTRQAAKPLNFGVPGGMGALKIVLTNRKKNAGSTKAPDGRTYTGIRFCILVGGEQRCGVDKIVEWKGKPCPPVCRRCVELVEHELRPKFFQIYPEVREYHEWVKHESNTTGEIVCFGPPDEDGQPTIERIRGDVAFCDGANNGFQALAADGAKHALRLYTREAYLDKSSPVYGSRPVFFVHDEIVSEMPIERAHLAGPRKAEIMKAAMRHYVRDVHIEADPALMEYWYKDAEPTFDEDGKLIVWTPEE